MVIGNKVTNLTAGLQQVKNFNFKILDSILCVNNSAVTYGIIDGNNGRPLSTVNARLLCYVAFLVVFVYHVAASPCLYALACANRIRH